MLAPIFLITTMAAGWAAARPCSGARQEPSSVAYATWRDATADPNLSVSRLFHLRYEDSAEMFSSSPCVRYHNCLDWQPYYSKAAETDLVCANMCHADQERCKSFLFHDSECHHYDYKFDEIKGEGDTVAIKGTCEEVQASGVTSELA